MVVDFQRLGFSRHFWAEGIMEPFRAMRFFSSPGEVDCGRCGGPFGFSVDRMQPLGFSLRSRILQSETFGKFQEVRSCMDLSRIWSH